MKKNSVKYIVTAAAVAALYTVLVIALAPISFGAIQFRIAEALTILPYFTPAAVPGLTAGCLLANIICGADVLDIIFGTLATFIGAVFSYLIRRYKYIVCVPPILANTIIIPFVLRYAYMDENAIPYLMLTVGIGEVVSCGVLGTLLLILLERTKVMRIVQKNDGTGSRW